MGNVREQIDFSDTELAFSYKSDEDLMQTYRMFKKIDSPFLTKVGPKLVNFSLKIGLPVKGMVKRMLFDIFCGGTSLENTRPRSLVLHKAGVSTILDYSVEGEKTEEGFDHTAAELARTLEFGAKHDDVAFSAMKVTGIANFDLLAKLQAGSDLSADEQASIESSKRRFEGLCKKALELGQPLFVDAEESWIQDVVDAWTEEMMEACNRDAPIVYTTAQLYRHDRLEYLRALIERSKEKGYILGVKLVRGAYIEKERDRAKELGYKDPMQPDKPSTDQDFNEALKLCVENHDHVAICAGTHNQDSSLLLAQLMADKGIAIDDPNIVFAQLLGMSDNISFNLAHHGYNVAKYLPYGPLKSVLPYLFRRAEENTAIAGQSSREVQLLRQEVERRKL